MKKKYIKPIMNEEIIMSVSLLTDSLSINDGEPVDPSTALTDDREWGNLW